MTADVSQFLPTHAKGQEECRTKAAARPPFSCHVRRSKQSIGNIQFFNFTISHHSSPSSSVVGRLVQCEEASGPAHIRKQRSSAFQSQQRQHHCYTLPLPFRPDLTCLVPLDLLSRETVHYSLEPKAMVHPERSLTPPLLRQSGSPVSKTLCTLLGRNALHQRQATLNWIT